MALPKTNRLSLRTSKEIFLGGKKFYSNYFTLIKSTIYDPISTELKFAIVVSKKVARKAHDRHKIRRLSSSLIYQLLGNFPVGSYLVYPKSTILTTSFPDLLADFAQLVSKLK